MRFLRSLKYAWTGIMYCFVHEKNFRIQFVITSLTVFGAIIFDVTVYEWIILLFCCMSVLSLEMINTTIEKLSNAITVSIHPVIKDIKDIAAGAVCLVSIVSFIIGVIIFIPKVGIIIKHINR